MTLKFPKGKYVYVHIIVWSLYITYNIRVHNIFYPAFDDYIGNIFDYLVLILVFYLNAHWVIEKYGTRKRIVLLVVFTFFLFVLYTGLLYCFQQYISPLIYNEPASDLRFKIFIWAAVYSFLPILGFSYGYWYVRRAIHNQKEINQLLLEQQREKEEKLRVEKERLFYEYSFLQAQINPHFLFNTLSFFYSRTLPFSREVSGGIMKLSEIMRYALENHPDKEGKVPLTREINHVRNVIDINQLRFNNKLNIEFIIQGNPESFQIIPLVLITLVENAFKHGDLSDPSTPLRVQLCISETGGTLRFKTCNKKNTGPAEPTSGIGMQNICNRLQWAYPANYHLEIHDEGEFYSAELQINL